MNYMNSNFYYVHNFFCVFVHLGLTIFRTRIWEQDLEHKEKRRQQDGDKDDLCPEGLIHEEECQDDADDV